MHSQSAVGRGPRKARETAPLRTLTGCATLALLLLGCAGSMAAEGAHEELDAVLWMQRSAERQALSLQIFAQARGALERALADPRWTAALGQLEDPDRADKPPAIILDVDETVLDNSDYEARRIRAGGGYEPESWQAWCKEANARPVPGAVAFTWHARSRGVRVFYLTNRKAHLKEATRRNLQARGFPLEDTLDTLITRGEKPEWSARDKEPRRQAILDEHRVLLLVGDNLGDFLSIEGADEPTRTELVAQHASWWGERWVVLPNPIYGSWETALPDFERALPIEEALRIKRLDLRTHP